MAAGVFCFKRNDWECVALCRVPFCLPQACRDAPLGDFCFPCGAVSRGAGLMPFAKCIAAVDVLFCHQKRTRKVRRCPQGMKAPVGLLSRRPVCAANAACSARQGHSDFDALDPRTRGCSPLVTPKRKSNRKKSSRFAQTGCGAQRPLRALSGTRVLLTAAPTAPPCIRRWRRSSPLHFFLGSPFAAPQPLRRQLPKWGAGLAGTGSVRAA